MDFKQKFLFFQSYQKNGSKIAEILNKNTTKIISL